MGWVEKRIKEYSEGQKATRLEKIMLGYWNPFVIVLFIIGTPILIYGIWIHNWLLITAGFIAVLIIGNIYSWYTGWAEKRIEEAKNGKKPFGWWEKRGLEEAHPIFFPLAFVFSMVFLYGLWAHNWWLIGIGIVVTSLGRLIPWLEKK